MKKVIQQKIIYCYNYTMEEFCGIVGKHKKTISRKIAQGQINPKIIKSKQGTKEYRFSDTDVKAFFWDELPLEVKSDRS